MMVRVDELIRSKCSNQGGTFVAFPAEDVETSIPERFEKMVCKYPNRLAIKAQEGEKTYDELNKEANRLARAIWQRQGGEAQPIGLLLDHDASGVVAVLAVLKAGKFYVPLDSSSPEARLKYMLEDSSTRLLVTHSRSLPLARRLLRKDVQILSCDKLDAHFSNGNLDLPISSAEIACILYTSGSTGQPKGVIQSHQNVLHFTMTYTNDLGICPDDRLTLLHHCSVSASMRNLFGALLNGASIFPFDLRKTAMSYLIPWLIEQEITIYHSVPTVYRHFMASLTGEAQFPKLRLINLSGEAATKSDALGYKTHFSPDCLFVNMWGATETGFVSQYFIDKDSAIPGPMLPLGYEVQDKEILLFDDRGIEVGVNQIGEITVRSRYLSPGYWQRPDLNRMAFSPDPSQSGRRLYRTGDLGRKLPNGCLVYLERKDFQVKVRGHRVEIAEAEAALLDHPDIKEGVIVAKQDRLHNMRLVAYIASEKAVPSTSRLRNFLKEKLPDYMIPSAFVLLDSLPRTPNGKIDRKALLARKQTEREMRGAPAQPRTPKEQTLTDIWADILKVEQVGIHDNFFDLGGHSLSASQIVARVFQQFRIQIPLQVLFQSPTVADMAAVIGDHQETRSGDEALESIVSQIERLPEDEAERLVKQHLSNASKSGSGPREF